MSLCLVWRFLIGEIIWLIVLCNWLFPLFPKFILDLRKTPVLHLFMLPMICTLYIVRSPHFSVHVWHGLVLFQLLRIPLLFIFTYTVCLSFHFSWDRNGGSCDNRTVNVWGNAELLSKLTAHYCQQHTRVQTSPCAGKQQLLPLVSWASP